MQRLTRHSDVKLLLFTFILNMDTNTSLRIVCGYVWPMTLVFVTIVTLLNLFFVSVKTYYSSKRKEINGYVVAFFHPYASDCGGGERVLWMSILSLLNRYPTNLKIIVYSGAKLSESREKNELFEKVHSRFNIKIIPETVDIVWLNNRRWIEASRYPFFTLLGVFFTVVTNSFIYTGQSFGGLFLGFEALNKFVPSVFIDTTGWAFTAPLFSLLTGCHTAAYVHYPTISTDMLERVATGHRLYNNRALISRNPLLTGAKLLYYKAFAGLYGLALRYFDVLMVNSTWTFNHIVKLVRRDDNPPRLVYPPCDVTRFAACQEGAELRLPVIVSIGQFRPEKDHELQLAAFSAFLRKFANDEHDFKMKIVGSCRNQEDEARLQKLQKLATDFGIAEQVEWLVNASSDDLITAVHTGTIGLHTMRDEHFGIGLVESMAGGLVMLAHGSGGPLSDIVDTVEPNRTGYLATDVDGYASAINDIFSSSPDELAAVRRRARESAQRFSDEKFSDAFLAAMAPLLVPLAEGNHFS